MVLIELSGIGANDATNAGSRYSHNLRQFNQYIQCTVQELIAEESAKDSVKSVSLASVPLLVTTATSNTCKCVTGSNALVTSSHALVTTPYFLHVDPLDYSKFQAALRASSASPCNSDSTSSGSDRS